MVSMASTFVDFIPVIGDTKGFLEAETPFDYLLVVVGSLGPVGDGLKKAMHEGAALYKAGRMDEAANILEQATASSKPGWLKKLDEGNEFNKSQSKNYKYNELYIERSDGKGYYRVDSYDPVKGEIVSRKYSQLSEINESSAMSYINEAVKKYPPQATIASVPSSKELAGDLLTGKLILEIPIQKSPIPASLLEHANRKGVIIRDITGRIY